ncbi:MAG: glycosyltransferase [Acidimicrobiales bacterium]|nr:glycosyltransferase [Acidimicrobiales bacterium]HRW36828.1 glycosyltransferase [Aquihabitans sp.]
MQLLVLGMHRSGTSMVTRLLNLAGAHFGPEGIATEANDENPKGFWERRDVRAICDALLMGAGADWWRAAGFDAASIPPEVLDEELPKLRRLILELDAHRPWVVKEPRLCLLLPVLRPLLEAPVAVHVTRDPLEVARSLARRNDFAVNVGTALWELYSVRALEASAGMPGVHVDHAALMADPVGALGQLLAALTAHGVGGLREPSEREVRAFVTEALHRQHGDRAEHPGWLTTHQAELAGALTSGLAFADPTAYEVSLGALDVLRTFERQRVHQLATEEELRASGRALAATTVRAEEEGGRADRAEQRVERELERFRHEQERAERAEARGDRLRDELSREEARRRERAALAREADAALARSEAHLERFLRTRTWRVPWKLTILKGRLTGHPVKVGPIRRSLDNVAVARRRLADSADADPGGAGPGPSAPEGPPRGASAPGPAPVDLASLPTPSPRTPGRPKVAVLAWDVGHNPLGRAWILAGMLERHYDVEIWGAQFERYGTAVWAPLRDGTIPVHAFPGRPFPDHLAIMDEVAARIDADLVWAAKPRLPSLALGVLAKQARNRPLVVDDDDHELAFFGVETGISLDEAAAQVRAGVAHAELPFERTWTRACDPLMGEADLLTVSNVALQERVGGMIVTHARDERLFDPARFDRREVRAELGFDDEHRLLLFGGTPRVHKGALEVLQALERLGDDRYRVLMFGTRELGELGPEVEGLRRWIAPLPYTPFDELPRLVAAADLSCVLQDPDHPVARYQLPAKITDALAMGVPCLVRDLPPIRPLVEGDVVAVLDDDQPLHERVAELFADRDALGAVAERGREWFLRDGSYEAVGARVAARFDELLAGDPIPVSPALAELVATPRELFPATVRTPPAPARRPGSRRRPLGPDERYDVVMFWKQNDSSIYGRRQDMVLEHLRRSDRVATIVHFDAPISPEQLVKTYRGGRGEASDQSTLVVRQTVERVLRRRDEPGVRRRTFVHAGSTTAKLRLPRRTGFEAYVRRTLEREGVGTGARPVVFWTFPTNADLPGLIDAFDPEVVVADVVDDNRTWYEPGSPGWDRTEANYREVLRRSDVVLANCEPVAEAMASFAPEVQVVPNGLELPAVDRRAHRGPRPAALADVRGPVLAYVGNLSARIDIALLEAVATARPEWTLVLVGSAHLDRSILALDRLANVRFLGVTPYAEVRRLLEHVDVGLIPHVDNEMTRAMNPLKAFVYASAGVPIVATPVANLAELGDLLTVAEGADAFVGAIEALLAAGRPDLDLEVLTPHSWDERVRVALDLVDDAMGGRAMRPAAGAR